MDQSSRLAAVAAAGAAVVDGTVVEACYAEHTGVVDEASAAAVAVVLEDVVAFGYVEHFVADVGWVVVFAPFYLPVYFNL